MKLRTALALLMFAAAPCLSAQTVTVDVAADAVQQFSIRGPARIQYTDKVVYITLGELPPGPNPGPTPGPTPPPTPDPVPPAPPPAPVATGKLYVTLVYDDAAETQAQATARADLATAPEWAGLDVVFRAYAASQKALDDLNLRSSVTRPPCLIVQELKAGDNKAPVIKTIPDLTDKAAAVDLVKSLRGAK